MKCNCGYEREYDIDTKTWIGKEDFIYSDMKITYNNNYSEYKKIVYICPKYGTLKIDI
jgi:hypothetical protein